MILGGVVGKMRGGERVMMEGRALDLKCHWAAIGRMMGK